MSPRANRARARAVRAQRIAKTALELRETARDHVLDELDDLITELSLADRKALLEDLIESLQLRRDDVVGYYGDEGTS